MAFATVLSSLGIKNDENKVTGNLKMEGTGVSMPFTWIKGKSPGKSILMTAGVHGGEYPCIETAIRIAKALDAKDVSGELLIIHPVNTTAFLSKMQYYGPLDGKNLNRVFPGDAKGTVSDRIAYVVNQLQKEADFYIDLHGGDIHESLVPFVIYPTSGIPEVTEQSKRIAAFFGFPYIVGIASENASIGGAATVGTPGILAELGQCGRWSEEEVSSYIHGTYNALIELGTLKGDVKEHEPQVLEKMVVSNANQEGCWYPFLALGDEVKKGEKVGEIRDFFGEVIEEYHATESGRLLYLVTSLAINKNDPLLALGV